jgi:Domain of unknown function (DUF6933)
MDAMVILRCTQKLRTKLGLRATQQEAVSTTTLGDWYGNLFYSRHTRLVMFVSERSRLAVLLQARDFPTLEDRFRAAVIDLLRHLGIEEEAIRREAKAMIDVAYAPTNSRSVLGTMNDYDRSLKCLVEVYPMITKTQLELRLSETPVGPMQYDSPRDVTQFLLSDWRSWTLKTQLQ